ncbi:MAG: metal ABC transporter ATP-binding protein [Verrucomicrobiota bacterium]
MHSGVPTSGSRSSSNPKPTLIRASGAGVRYGTYQALRNIDLTILQGDRLAVIGPNGAGKTTLLRLLLGLESPSEGSVFWSEPRSQIGYVPQRLDFDASFPLTVEEFLAVNNPKSGIWLGGVPRKIKKDITIALAKTGASEVKRQLIGTLSGGQLQRTLIASALLQNPKVLILDEPSASIDKQGAKDLQKLLFDLNKSERITLVFVSHDLHLVSELANRVACLNVNLCGLGEPAEVLGSHILGHNPTVQIHNQFEQREKV